MGHCGRCHSFAAAPLSRTREEDSAPEVGRSGTCAQLQWPSRSRVKRTPCHIASRKPVPSKLTRKWKLSRADGLVSVVLGVDVVQRPRGGRVDFRAFGPRAVLDLLKQTKDGSALPVLPLFGITQKKRRHAHLVCRSARWSCLAGGDGFWASSKSLRSVVRWWWGGASAGFRLDSHRIAWVRVCRFSDAVFGALRNAKANFAGRVCPRSRGEVGVRVTCGSDISTIRRCLEEGMDARERTTRLLTSASRKMFLFVFLW